MKSERTIALGKERKEMVAAKLRDKKREDIRHDLDSACPSACPLSVRSISCRLRDDGCMDTPAAVTQEGTNVPVTEAAFATDHYFKCNAAVASKESEASL